jgi:hypothetical protein
MKKATVALGMSALLFAAIDLILGQHVAYEHRSAVHLAEFVFFFSFFILVEIGAFRLMTKLNLDPWVAGIVLSVVSFSLGLALFGLAGGSAHGDGGPIAVSLAVMGCLGAMGMLMSIVGLFVARFARKRIESSGD